MLRYGFNPRLPLPNPPRELSPGSGEYLYVGRPSLRVVLIAALLAFLALSVVEAVVSPPRDHMYASIIAVNSVIEALTVAAYFLAGPSLVVSDVGIERRSAFGPTQRLAWGEIAEVNITRPATKLLPSQTMISFTRRQGPWDAPGRAMMMFRPRLREAEAVRTLMRTLAGGRGFRVVEPR